MLSLKKNFKIEDQTKQNDKNTTTSSINLHWPWVSHSSISFPSFPCLSSTTRSRSKVGWLLRDLRRPSESARLPLSLPVRELRASVAYQHWTASDRSLIAFRFLSVFLRPHLVLLLCISSARRCFVDSFCTLLTSIIRSVHFLVIENNYLFLLGQSPISGTYSITSFCHQFFLMLPPHTSFCHIFYVFFSPWLRLYPAIPPDSIPRLRDRNKKSATKTADKK